MYIFVYVVDNKTKPTEISPASYLESKNEDSRAPDAVALLALMSSVTKTTPVMWGPGIVGFGVHEYTYDSGRTGTAPAVSFALRQKNLVIYGLHQTIEEEMGLFLELGPHTMGKGCLYIDSFADINVGVLKRLTKKAFTARHNVRTIDH